MRYGNNKQWLPIRYLAEIIQLFNGESFVREGRFPPKRISSLHVQIEQQTLILEDIDPFLLTMSK